MDQLQLSPPSDPVEIPWERSQVRVPREDGGLLAIPNLCDAPEAAVRNREHRAYNGCQILGVPLKQFRQHACDESLVAAERYTSRILGRDCGLSPAGPLIATGHQPDLFHPGVWVKQYAASELARRCNGVGLNLIVDSDMMRSHRIRVPVGTRNRPGAEWLPFDAQQAVGPWQDARIVHSSTFESFGSRVTQAMSRWDVTPVIAELWPHAVAHSRVDSGLAECLSAARIQTEWNWGEGNLELPLSGLCTTDSFLWFAVALLDRADEFRETYNDALNQYRAINRIRSESHPVPELAHTDGWTEAPFMVWQSGDIRRSHVFVRRSGTELLLASGPEEAAIFGRLPLGPDGDASDAVSALRDVQSSGYRFRTRALTTTLFTRLCLSDLFVHGIGGAKYDEITDRIIKRFYGIDPPEFLTLSATAWLPLAKPFSETADDVRRIRGMLRELQHNPQRFLPSKRSESVNSLVDEKQRLIAVQQSSDQTRHADGPAFSHSGIGRYRRFPEINRELTKQLSKLQQRLIGELADVEQRLLANTILTGREWSFCLYPADRMHRMIADLHAAFDA
jgi:hypothetical protein